MLRELQALSNSFQPDTVSESSKSSLPSTRQKDLEQPGETPASTKLRRNSYLQHPSDPAYSRNVSQLYDVRRSADSRNSETYTDERESEQTSEAIIKVHSEHSHNVQREVQSDPIEDAEQRTSSKLSKVRDLTDSTDAQKVLPGDLPPRPRHAVFQDPVAALARLSSASKGSAAEPSAEHSNRQSEDTKVRSHRHAVFGDATLVSDAQQESASDLEDADVQQILKDLKDNASSHAAFEDVDSLEGDEESEEDSWEGEDEESDEESEDVDDEHSDKE
eukprot:Skav207912  [mRNA]  locus=scaffold190:264965:265792:- [translate_table: standard]